MSQHTLVYAINRNSQVYAYIEEGGLRVVLPLDSREIRVEGVQAPTSGEAIEQVGDLAERFLDSVSRSLNVHYQLVSRDPTVETVDASGRKTSTVGIAPSYPFSVGVGPPVTAATTDTSGRIIDEFDPAKPYRVPLSTSAGPRYYRKAANSRDVFEQFRNLYFVLEHVGSRLWWRTQGGKWGSDLDLVERAVREAFPDTVRLRAIAKNVPGINDKADGEVHNHVARYLLISHRQELSHAQIQNPKKKPRRKIPYDVSHEDAVRDAMPLVEVIARRLLELELQTFGP